MNSLAIFVLRISKPMYSSLVDMKMMPSGPIMLISERELRTIVFIKAERLIFLLVTLAILSVCR